MCLLINDVLWETFGVGFTLKPLFLNEETYQKVPLALHSRGEESFLFLLSPHKTDLLYYTCFIG